MGELAVKYGFYSAEWDPKPHGTAFPMGEGTIVHYIFAALIIGMLVGGALTWFGQGKFRRRLRERTHEAYRWHSEATRLNREVKATASSGAGLPATIGAGKS